MRARRRSLVLAVVGLLACGAPPPPREGAVPGDAAAIRAARAAQNQAIAARDLERVASYWTDDVVITAGLGRVLRGRAEYRRAFELDSAMIYAREPERVETSANWPLAFESGTWSGWRASTDGPPLLRGRYSAQWAKRDGRWLIHSEVFVALECADPACDWPLASP